MTSACRRAGTSSQERWQLSSRPLTSSVTSMLRDMLVHLIQPSPFPSDPGTRGQASSLI